MSEDEVVVLVISLVAAAVVWCLWYLRCFRLSRRQSGNRAVWLRWVLCFGPVACGVLLWTVLRLLASHDVRNSGAYLTFYMALGAAWVGMFAMSTAATGISLRDDALERGNFAAACAIVGGLVGLTLCFAGGNVGDGPGWWVVVYCGGLSAAAFFACWAALEMISGISELVTIDRDLASGLRLAGFLVAEGLILGRAVAGDWESVRETNIDFLQRAWPALFVLFGAFVLDRLCRPSVENPAPSPAFCGIAPAGILFVGAAVWVAILGLPG